MYVYVFHTKGRKRQIDILIKIDLKISDSYLLIHFGHILYKDSNFAY